MVPMIAFLRIGTSLVASLISAAAQDISAPPRFEDYPAGQLYVGKPAIPILSDPAQRLYGSRIRAGVDKGWGVYGGGSGDGEGPGPNFAGHYMIIQWGCGSTCIQMAVVDAETGRVYSPPLTVKGNAFVLPLLTVGNRVSRYAEVQFRVDSRLVTVSATPVQSERHPSCEYYFLLEQNRWKLLKRIQIPDNARLPGDP